MILFERKQNLNPEYLWSVLKNINLLVGCR